MLELRKGNVDAARSNFHAVQGMAPHMFEPFFNGALLAYKLGDFQESFELATKALALCEGHHDSLELLKQLTLTCSGREARIIIQGAGPRATT